MGITLKRAETIYLMNLLAEIQQDKRIRRFIRDRAFVVGEIVVKKLTKPRTKNSHGC